MRILFVFAWLIVDGEETEVRLLAQTLDPVRYATDVVACFRKEGMPGQTHDQLARAGVRVDTTPYHLSFDETVAYLASIVPGYDAVVSCQNVADIYPALERLHLRPPLVEHGGLVSEALAGPKHFTTRYVGVCASIRDAAASRMPGREGDAIEIPSMVDLSPYRRVDRTTGRAMRASLGIDHATPLIGWAGRLDAKKRVEDVIAAAAIVHAVRPDARFLVIGGPDAFMPDYAVSLREQVRAAGLDGALHFLGDRADIPQLLSAPDIFVWLSRGEGMPHVVAEAGAASLPVIATADNGTLQQIEDGVSGLFVRHGDPLPVAAAMLRLIEDASLRQRLGDALHAKVERDYAVEAVVPQWQRLFDAIHRPPPIDRHHPLSKPFHRILAEPHARYGRPIFVAETGIEGDDRPAWLAHVAGEVHAAQALGVPVQGVCLYPVLDHPGWDDERPCPNGLLHTVADGTRRADPAYAAELARQVARR